MWTRINLDVKIHLDIHPEGFLQKFRLDFFLLLLFMITPGMFSRISHRFLPYVFTSFFLFLNSFRKFVRIPIDVLFLEILFFL